MEATEEHKKEIKHYTTEEIQNMFLAKFCNMFKTNYSIRNNYKGFFSNNDAVSYHTVCVFEDWQRLPVKEIFTEDNYYYSFITDINDLGLKIYQRFDKHYIENLIALYKEILFLIPTLYLSFDLLAKKAKTCFSPLLRILIHDKDDVSIGSFLVAPIDFENCLTVDEFIKGEY